MKNRNLKITISLFLTACFVFPQYAFAATAKSKPNNADNDLAFNYGAVTLGGTDSFSFTGNQMGLSEITFAQPTNNQWLKDSPAVKRNLTPITSGEVGVQVTDDRGTNSGWTLSAYATDLQSESGSLTGSEIVLYGGNAMNAAKGVEIPSLSANTVLTTGSGSNATNAAVNIATAPRKGGGALNATGINVLPFKGVALVTPNGIDLNQSYSGNIVWNLTTAP
ncbi:WxL domain-containing protein [Lactococcus sp.]|uniref:WxL domain-containing protein n=1 Tax=Lactococcus sp. TaxID=44273 RepID=UPI0035AF70C0